MPFSQTNRNMMVDREIRLLSMWLLTPIAPTAVYLFTFHSPKSEIFYFFSKIGLPSITEMFPMCRRRSTFYSITVVTLCSMSNLLWMQRHSCHGEPQNNLFIKTSNWASLKSGHFPGLPQPSFETLNIWSHPLPAK